MVNIKLIELNYWYKDPIKNNNSRSFVQSSYDVFQFFKKMGSVHIWGVRPGRFFNIMTWHHYRCHWIVSEADLTSEFRIWCQSPIGEARLNTVLLIWWSSSCWGQTGPCLGWGWRPSRPCIVNHHGHKDITKVDEFFLEPNGDPLELGVEGESDKQRDTAEDRRVLEYIIVIYYGIYRVFQGFWMKEWGC